MSKTDKRAKIFWGIGASLFILFFIAKAIKNKHELKNLQDYTVGIALDTYKGIKQPIPCVEYIYNVKGVKYKHTHGFDPKIYKVELGKKYLVIYSPGNPANSRILLKAMLPDSVYAPNNGWGTAPFGITDTLDSEW